MNALHGFWQPRGNDFGLALATVVDTDDPRGLGRVKVEFELKRDPEGNKVQSDWLQFASPYAGAEIGMFFLPAAGGSALVAFSGSDPGQAYVIGFVWDGRSKPPVQADKQKDVRVIYTKNHKITIDDSGRGAIEIAGQDGNSISIDSEGNKMEIKCSGDISISADKKLSIKAGEISVEATGNMELKSDANMSLNPIGELSLKC